jgi:PEP-CTERM motif
LGQIVGTYTDSAGNGHGFIDTHGHFTTFDEPNAALGPGTQPLAINDLGQIFGWYYDANFNIYAFLATPSIFPFASLAADPLAAVPEASTWAMMLMGFAGLGLAAFRKRPRKTALTIS